MNNLAGIVVGSVTTGLVLKYGWSVTSVILGIAACILILITFFGVKEHVGIDAVTGKVKTKEVPFKDAVPVILKNKYFFIIIFVGILTLVVNANAIASMIFYCNNVVGDPMFMTTLMSIGQIPGLAILLFMPALSKKFGKRQFMLAGIVLMIIGFVVLGLADGNRSLVLAGTILRSIGISYFAGIYALLQTLQITVSGNSASVQKD